MSDRAPDGMPTENIHLFIEEAHNKRAYWEMAYIRALEDVTRADRMWKGYREDCVRYEKWLEIRDFEESGDE